MTPTSPQVGQRVTLSFGNETADQVARAASEWLISELKQLPPVRTIIAIGGDQGSLRAQQKETLGRMTKSLGLAEGAQSSITISFSMPFRSFGSSGRQNWLEWQEIWLQRGSDGLNKRNPACQ